MKEALSPLRTLLAVMGRKDCQGYLDGSTENTFGGGGVFFSLFLPFFPSQSISNLDTLGFPESVVVM